MTTPNTGILTIEFTDQDQPVVIFQPVNGEVWLSLPQLAELFGVFVRTLTADIETIYRANVFNEKETSRYNLYTSGTKIKYDKTHFNLEIIIALAFRIGTWQAQLIRRWIIKQLLERQINFTICQNNNLYHLN